MVRALYRHFIQRWPEDREVDFWVGQISANSNGWRLMIKSLMDSPDYVARHSYPIRQKKIFFFHLPKAGGTSIARAIRAASDPRWHAPYFANNTNQYRALNGCYDEYKGYDIYLGHCCREIYEEVNNGHRYLINFRHPVSRIVSLYNYFRQDERLEDKGGALSEMNLFCAHAARSKDFFDFISMDHPYVRTWMSDFQFFQLTSNPWIRGSAAVSVEDAFAFIDGALGLFICEYSRLSALRLATLLNLDSVPYENTTFDRVGSLGLEDVSEEAVDLIMSLNPRDTAIYDYAVKSVLND